MAILFLIITPALVILSKIYYDSYPPSPTSIANLPSSISLEKTLEGHSDSVSSVAYSPNGQTLASGGGEDKRYTTNVVNQSQTVSIADNSLSD
ncbi:hypothetical protein IQ222_17065 [Dolichospermum flos-aquae LEGE 04289]|uniref:Uncharacterized protein n=2 Tax=Dolichospermum flosaquae TaxID=1166 RepID=A0ACC5Q4Z7_DOLFA|nr:hypothetical protein [Dolichospermum flos-aquae LEGE 04289]